MYSVRSQPRGHLWEQVTWTVSQNNLAQKRVALASLQTLSHSSFLTSTKSLKPPPGLICLTQSPPQLCKVPEPILLERPGEGRTTVSQPVG